MGKQIKHDFNKRANNTPNTAVDSGKTIQMAKNIQVETSKELMNNNTAGVRQFADIATKVLREEL
jgi:hypothetical protein